MIGYISLGLSLVSLLLGLYNWNQSLVRLRADTRIYPTINEAWAIETVISNKSSRAVTILKTYVEKSKGIKIEEAEVRNTGSFYVYMHDGRNVGSTKHATTYPMQINNYGACEVQRVVIAKPPKDSKLVIVTPAKTFKFKINVPEGEQPN